MKIKLLDCTLRDGAHVTKGKFGFDHIRDISDGLSNANVDIVELGFLKHVNYDLDITSFPHMDEAYQLVDNLHSKNKKNVDYALMVRADEYDADEISESSGQIKILRVAFYYDYLDKAFIFAQKAISKKYQISLNLINTPGCTMEELNRFVNYVNEIKPFAVSIVDTFGVLDLENLEKIVELYDSKLDKNVKIGLHVHENCSLSVALAQSFLNQIQKNRDVIIDCSLTGIGRAPGNLCTEIITHYLNKKFEKKYDLSEILKIADHNIVPLKKRFKWGYSPEYFVSAIYKVHRSYAEALQDRGFGLDQIDTILSKIDQRYAGKFNGAYLEQLVSNYK